MVSSKSLNEEFFEQQTVYYVVKNIFNIEQVCVIFQCSNVLLFFFFIVLNYIGKLFSELMQNVLKPNLSQSLCYTINQGIILC